MQKQRNLENKQFPEKVKITIDTLKDYISVDPIIDIITEYTYRNKISGLCTFSFNGFFKGDIYPDPNCLSQKHVETIRNEKVYKLRFLEEKLTLFVLCAKQKKLIHKVDLLDEDEKIYHFDTGKTQSICAIDVDDIKNELFVPNYKNCQICIFDIITGKLLNVSTLML